MDHIYLEDLSKQQNLIIEILKYLKTLCLLYIVFN